GLDFGACFGCHCIELIHLTGHALHIGFYRAYAYIGGLCGAHVRFSKANLVRDQLALRIATSFDFYDQSSQDVSNRVFLTTAEKTAICLYARIVGYENLIVCPRRIANRENICITVDNDASELHL